MIKGWSQFKRDNPKLARNFIERKGRIGAEVLNEGHDWDAAQPRNLVKGYREGDLRIVVPFRARFECGYCEFVFGCIPALLGKEDLSALGVTFKPEPGSGGARGQDDLVLVGSDYLPKVEDNVVAAGIAIPSWVRLQTSEYGMEGGRNSSFFKDVLQIGRVSSPWEIHITLGRLTEDGGGCVESQLVEEMPQIAENPVDELPDLRRERLCQSDLLAMTTGIRIELGESFIWLCIEERLQALCEFGGVFMRPVEKKPGAFEG